jgi:hypothetical protein
MNSARRRSGGREKCMRTIATRAAPLVLAAIALGATAAAPDARIDVTLNHTGNDAAGKRLAAAVANSVSVSTQMKLVKSSDLRIGLYLATMPRGGSTIYSATWTIGGMVDDGYLTSRVGVCDNEAIRSCARGIAAETARHAGVLWAMKSHPAPAR